MLRTRVIPCLLIQDGALVKSIQFKEMNYIGDPLNAVRIFNELEVDEIIVLDISATPEGRGPDLKLIGEISSQCFMPLTYGGGVKSVDDFKKLYGLGVEKVAVNSEILRNPGLISDAASVFGSQSVIASIDVKKGWFNKYQVFSKVKEQSQQIKLLDPVEYAKVCESLGAGEIFLNSVDLDGTMTHYDTHLIKSVTEAVNLPVIACGGAGAWADFRSAVDEGGAAAVAAGSVFVYQSRMRSVLINFPTPAELKRILGD